MTEVAIEEADDEPAFWFLDCNIVGGILCCIDWLASCARKNELNLRIVGAAGLVSRSDTAESIAAVLRKVMTDKTESKELRVRTAGELAKMKVGTLGIHEIATLADEVYVKSDSNFEPFFLARLLVDRPTLSKDSAPILLKILRWDRGDLAEHALQGFEKIGPPAKEFLGEIVTTTIPLRPSFER